MNYLDQEDIRLPRKIWMTIFKAFEEYGISLVDMDWMCHFPTVEAMLMCLPHFQACSKQEQKKTWEMGFLVLDSHRCTNALTNAEYKRKGATYAIPTPYNTNPVRFRRSMVWEDIAWAAKEGIEVDLDCLIPSVIRGHDKQRQKKTKEAGYEPLSFDTLVQQALIAEEQEHLQKSGLTNTPKKEKLGKSRL